ncbi:hypothetical protein [Hymenobacter algoricola]|uniref:Uncharacterized protein n=1 Tax=Hymenobacter algoricola TaxID=486267 RepID=A0ABP7NTS0_9BACT
MAKELTIEELKAQNATLTAENKQLKADAKASEGIIAGQAKKLANIEAAQGEDAPIVVTHEDNQYRVLGKQFNIKGAIVKASELGENEEAVKHLVVTQSDLLQLVVKANAAK